MGSSASRKEGPEIRTFRLLCGGAAGERSAVAVGGRFALVFGSAAVDLQPLYVHGTSQGARPEAAWVSRGGTCRSEQPDATQWCTVILKRSEAQCEDEREISKLALARVEVRLLHLRKEAALSLLKADVHAG